MKAVPRNTILQGDALDRLRELPTASVDCGWSSPPYFALRDNHVAGQIGLEGDVSAWVARLRQVFREFARVLTPTGTLWLNVADSYSRHPKYGAPAKSLLLGPQRLLLALAADGWIVRNVINWSKPNAMPNSVGDRLTNAYEQIFLLTRSPRYYFDLDQIREPHRSRGGRSAGVPTKTPPAWAGPLAGTQDGLRRARAAGTPGHELGKNPTDSWSIPTRGVPGHHSSFPEALARRPILAGCPEAICTRCGAPWRRTVSVRRLGRVTSGPRDRYVNRYPSSWRTIREVGALVPCGCGARTRPGLVCDPFMGSGTTAVVAEQLGRDWLGIELNQGYIDLAWQRIRAARPPDQQVAA